MKIRLGFLAVITTAARQRLTFRRFPIKLAAKGHGLRRQAGLLSASTLRGEWEAR